MDLKKIRKHSEFLALQITAAKIDAINLLNQCSAADLREMSSIYREYKIGTFHLFSSDWLEQGWIKEVSQGIYRLTSLGIRAAEVLRELSLKNLLEAKRLEITLKADETKESLENRLKEASEQLTTPSEQDFQKEYVNISRDDVVKVLNTLGLKARTRVKEPKIQNHSYVVDFAKFASKPAGTMFKKHTLFDYSKDFIKVLIDLHLIKVVHKTLATSGFILTPLGVKVGKRIKELGILNVGRALQLGLILKRNETKASLEARVKSKIKNKS